MLDGIDGEAENYNKLNITPIDKISVQEEIAMDDFSDGVRKNANDESASFTLGLR